jgi:hypothetical protein
MAIVEFAFDVISGLVTEVIQKKIDYTPIPFFERLKIKNRINESLGAVVEPLLPFLENEGISEDKQRRLIQACIDELKPLAENPEQLFQGSLDGQKIFDQLYENRELPQVVIEDGLKDTYTLLCPRIATLLCKIPAAVKDWENEAWSENYRRLDDIANQLRQLFNYVDEISSASSKQADELLLRVRRSLAQKVGFKLDLTGLRADQVVQGKFDDLFIYPQFLLEYADYEPITPDTDPGGIQDFFAHVLSETINFDSPEKAFEYFIERSPLVITGSAGSGKSTWSKWLQKQSLSLNWTGISVRVELRGLRGNPPSLHELIREAAGKHIAEEVTVERIGCWLDNKQVLFILDGFDEIRPSERDEIYQWIIDLHLAARGCPFVLTSRLLTSDHLERFKNSWVRCEISPFDKPRIVDYIQRWYASTPLLSDGNRDINAEGLASSWRNDPTIEPLTENPLLLSTLLMVHHLDGELPTGRSKLYERYVEGMLGLWDSRRDVSSSSITLSLIQKKQIIREFAIKLFFEQKDQLDEADTLAWLESLLAEMNISLEASEVLDFLRERSGLIVGPGIYSFSHKTISEYLVAEAVFQGDRRDPQGNRIDRFCLFENRDDDRWNTVLFLWAGLAPITDVETFIEECLKADSWTLACGILLDQYDRIPSEIRRKLIFISFDSCSIISKTAHMSWGVCGPGAMCRGFQLRHIGTALRGISAQGQDFRFLISRLIEDNIITLQDLNVSEGQARDIIWLSFINSRYALNDFDLLKAFLGLRFPEKEDLLMWLEFVVEYGLRRNVNDPSNLRAAIKKYQDVHPAVKAIMPLTLISLPVSMDVDQEIFRIKITEKPDCVHEVLKALLDSKEDEVSLEWLTGTHKWSTLTDSDLDLLSCFSDLIRRLIKEGKIEDDSTTKGSIEFVHRLIERRKSLVPRPE